MKRVLLGLTVTMAAAGCNNVEVGLVVEEVPPPTATCGFEVGEIEYPLVYDSLNMNSMFVPTEVSNVMSPSSTRIVTVDPEVNQELPLTVTPLRFDFQWECDSNGFSANRGPLILPAFSVDNPFCLDTRDEANSDFAGFDVVSASGAPVPPEGTQIWEFTPITPELGQAFNVAFSLAEQSQLCCCEAAGDPGCANRESNCAAVPNFATVGACDQLQDDLDAVAPGRFNVAQAGTIFIWQPYVLFTPTGANLLERGIIPNFKLRLRGVYEGITAAGDLITSTEFIRDIGVCRGDAVGTELGRCTLELTETCFQPLTF